MLEEISFPVLMFRDPEGVFIYQRLPEGVSAVILADWETVRCYARLMQIPESVRVVLFDGQERLLAGLNLISGLVTLLMIVQANEAGQLEILFKGNLDGFRESLAVAIQRGEMGLGDTP